MKTPKKLQKAASSTEQSTAAFSRRDFITAAAATGIAMGVGRPAVASAEVVAPSPENSLPDTKPEMYTGTPSGAVLAQLKAAGVRTLFHTNTSGFVPFWEAIYAAGDVLGPTLASIAMEQGRAAVCHAFGIPFEGTVDQKRRFFFRIYSELASRFS